MKRRGNGEGSVTRRADGRWMGRIVVDGTRRTVYGKTQREAVARLNDIRAGKTPAGKRRPSNAATVGEWVTRWREDLLPAAGLEKTTAATYASLAKTHLEQAPEIALPLGDLKPSDVGRLIGRLADTRSRSTVRQVYAVFALAIDAAVADGLVEVNVVRSVKRPKPSPPRHAVLDEDKVRRAIDAVPERYRVMIEVAASLGLREGEVVGLLWKDVDLESGVVRIERALKEVSGHPLYYGDPKQGSKRTITAPKRVLELLKAHRAAVAELALMRGFSAGGDAPVFVNLEGGPIRPKTAYRVWSTAAKSVGLTDRRLHALRHRAVHRLQAAGASPATTAAIVGHADVATTMRIYTATSSSEQAAALEAVDTTLTPTRNDNGEQRDAIPS